MWTFCNNRELEIEILLHYLREFEENIKILADKSELKQAWIFT